MAIDFKEAQRLTDVALRPDWTKPPLYVSDAGWEDQWGFGVSAQNAAGIPPGLIPGPTHIVTKAGGSVRKVTLGDAARILLMTRVGRW